MSNIIQIKRGSGVPATGVLAGYELGWDTLNNSLYIGVNGADPIKIADAFAGYLSIDKTSGKLYATTALEVDGVVDFNSTLTVDGITTINNELYVTGLSSLDGGIDVNGAQFTVSTAGNIYTAGTLTVDGGSTLGDSADDVNAIRGTVTISDLNRTTTVQGALEVDQNTGIDGNVRIGDSGTTKVSIAGATGNISTTGTLTVDDVAEFNSDVGVDGATTLRSTLAVTGASTFTGDVTAQNNVGVEGNTTLGTTSADTLTVNATSTFNSPLTVATGQLASLDGGIDVNGNVTINATTGNIVTNGDITAQNATINGDLVVHGTTTTVNSTTVEIADPIFTLGETLAVSDAKDRGIELKYGDTTTPLVGFFGLDESTGRFTFIPDAVNTAEVFTGDIGDVEFGEIYQSQTSGVYDVDGTVVNASANWNAAAKALGISGGTGGASSAVQYDLLQADANGQFQPTKTISAASGITIDCGTY
jgi:hypothetical protein